MNEPNSSPNPQYLAPLPTSTLAIVSLVAGIAGFTILPFIAGIIAIAAGYMARSETRSIPPKAGGDGLATAGIILGIIQLVLAVVTICCIALYFLFVGGILLTSGGQ
jgi:hypothetical protein